ncbi:MAG TPA: SCO family protein, partial [Pyrinomonadaceae bacterium]|nr:SCO family protein [Pyrinomonadaceae bacterium]
KRYPFVGKVVSVNKAAKKATISHEDIPGYMGAMTMEFPIHEDWVWNDLTPGSEVHADLVVDNTAKDPFWLEKVGIVAAADPNQTPTPDPTIGKQVPDFTLTNQDGKKISMKDFRGKALAITFIYARCPLPDYCIRISTNFSDLANSLKDNADLKDKVRLLSISFDPENDTPAKLRQYGQGYLGNQASPDFTIWQLAVGSDAEVRKVAGFFGLDYRVDENNKAVITHNLRTAVISPDGKVIKVYAGNEWTPAQLLNDLKSATQHVDVN